MALNISGVSSGRVDLGDTKTLSVTPKDSDGTAIAPTTLTAVFTPETGTADTYDIDDFTLSSGVYLLDHTFDVAGRWDIAVTAVDSASRTEVERYAIIVHAV